MEKSFAVSLFTRWATENRFIPLYIKSDYDGTGEPFRLWWFFGETELFSPRSGLCDEEVISFFSHHYHLTEWERAEIDREFYS